MREFRLVDALATYTTITGKDAERIFLNPDDWRKLGADVYPFGPAELRTGLRSYAGLPIEFIPAIIPSFVGPNPPDMKVPEDENNPAMCALLGAFSRGVRTLRPSLDMTAVNRLEINMAWDTIICAELRAGIPIDAIDLWDVFKRARVGQRAVLACRHPLTRLVNWCQDNAVSILGYEPQDSFKLVYPALHLTDEACMLLADE